MGMTNDEINAMIAGESAPEVTEKRKNKRTSKKDTHVSNPDVSADNSVESNFAISQAEVDSVLAFFVTDDDKTNSNKQSLIEEIHSAILDSGRLTLAQWMNLRKKLREIEELIPHIDLIIRLKSKKERSALE